MTSIMSAITAGYNPQWILRYLSETNPELAHKIGSALEAGHTLDHVLNFLQKNEKRMGNPAQPQQKESNPYKKMKTSIHPSLKGAAKAAGTAVGAMAGGYALSRAIPQILQRGAAANAVEGASLLPGSSETAQQLPLPVDQNRMQPNNVLANEQSLSSQKPPIDLGNANNIPQNNNIQQPNIDTKIIKNSVAYKSQIDALVTSGNGPEEIEAYLKKFNPSFIKTIEKEGKAPFKDVLGAYLKETVGADAMNPPGSTPDNPHPIATQKPEIETLNEPIETQTPSEPIEQPVKIEKSSVVSSPQGIGEVKEIRNGQALIEVDGKLHKVKEEDLIESPLPKKDLGDLYDDFIEGIEEETGEDVSRMVQWAGYNPETNTLQFLPHTGKLYKYGDISPEDASLLTDILSTRKTSGENFIGAWKKDSKSPIGAALSKLIRKLQSERGGKGNEYEETHDPIYSAYEPAVLAAKKKKKKK